MIKPFGLYWIWTLSTVFDHLIMLWELFLIPYINNKNTWKDYGSLINILKWSEETKFTDTLIGD